MCSLRQLKRSATIVALPLAVAKGLKAAPLSAEQVSNGRHVAFIEAPDGAQMELIEKTA
jgi:hypothetical protein